MSAADTVESTLEASGAIEIGKLLVHEDMNEAAIAGVVGLWLVFVLLDGWMCGSKLPSGVLAAAAAEGITAPWESGEETAIESEEIINEYFALASWTNARKRCSSGDSPKP